MLSNDSFVYIRFLLREHLLPHRRRFDSYLRPFLAFFWILTVFSLNGMVVLIDCYFNFFRMVLICLTLLPSFYSSECEIFFVTSRYLPSWILNSFHPDYPLWLYFYFNICFIFLTLNWGNFSSMNRSVDTDSMIHSFRNYFYSG